MIPNPAVKRWKPNYERWIRVQKWYATEYRALFEHARQKFYEAFEFQYTNVEKKFESQVRIYLTRQTKEYAYQMKREKEHLNAKLKDDH